MKTNLSSLMNVVAEEERKFSEYGCNVNEYAYLRKMKFLYSSLLNKRFSKRRVTEVNNS